MAVDFEHQDRYQALYSDGQTARSHKVTVYFGPKRLAIIDEDGEEMEGWVYHQISTIQPLDPGQTTQLGNQEQPGARLYIERADFADELITHLPHMSRRASNRRILIPLISFGALITTALVVTWLSGYSVSGAIARKIPDNVRQGLGEQVVASISGGRSACTSPEGNAAFQKLVGRLTTGAGHNKKFKIQVMSLSMMNAFAAPGEHIVVAAKLIDFVDSPEELAGVIAHEMGHGIKMHPEAGLVRAIGISAGLNIAFGGSTGGLGDIGGMLLQLNYSRSAETEADTIALSILEKAEIPAKPFASFFARLEEEHGSAQMKRKLKKLMEKNGRGESPTKPSDEQLTRETGKLGKTLELFSTHPPSPERIEHIKNQPDWPTRPLLSAQEWNAISTICKGDKSSQEEDE